MNALITTICTFVTSTIGRKILVALTGVSIAAFLLGHMAGNMTIFWGPDAINAYAHHLHTMPWVLLWGFRVAMIVLFGIHIWLTIQLKRENVGARDAYAYKNTITATWSSRYMIYSGCTILAFVIFHILQFTVRVGLNPDEFQTVLANGDPTYNVYKMMVLGFSNVWVSGFYILAMALLFTHLRHGVQSVFQTLGLCTSKVRPLYNLASIGYALVVCLGFISIPLAVLIGLVK